MILWTLFFICLGTGLWIFFQNSSLSLSLFKNKTQVLAEAAFRLRELEEMLQSGLLPEVQKWEKLKFLDPPWGDLISESIQSLRSQGAELLPTLKRFRELAQELKSLAMDVKAKQAQAMAQALVSAGLVPVFSIALYLMLPGLETSFRIWLGVTGGAFFISVLGATWLFALAEQACWGGLPIYARSWVLHIFCFGERFLSMLRAGSPADLSWSKNYEALLSESPELAEFWGASIWKDPEAYLSSTSLQVLKNSVTSIRKSVQLSLLEGRPCTDRIEAALYSLRLEWKSQVERETGFLATRSLKPLFLCIAPALLGLLVVGLWLSWESVIF